VNEIKPLFKIGLIINPISGMGGSVGLKGTDGVLREAIELGAQPSSNNRAENFLKELLVIRDNLMIYTPPGVMGENIARSLGFKVNVIDKSIFSHPIEIYKTSKNDTKASSRFMKEKVSLIVFVGGDGTARDLFEEIGQEIPCLGIPGGVKIHSSVFSLNPVKAAHLTMEFLLGEAPLRESEVLDIDEEEFRNNRLISKLYGYLLTPYSPIYSQPSKMASPATQDERDNQEAIGQWVIEEMKENVLYILGPGTTTKAITELLGEQKTLLGVDLVKNKKIVAKDLNEDQILEIIGDFDVKLIVTPIGRQGFVFGRGNLQISSKVIRRIQVENIIIICTKYKYNSLPDRKMRVDTRDPNFDKELVGMYRILVDYGEYRIATIE
jgi:predicted polyphosphate/ATP-dependent NAD kinase